MEIGERLRTLRKSKRISIYRLSQETGISQNHISDLETGKRNPSVETLKRLVEPLGISLSELFNEDGVVSVLNENERELVENYRLLPDEKASVLLKLSDMLKNDSV